MKKLLFTISTLLFAQFSFSQTTHPVSFSGFTFNPDTVTIDVGDNVQWTLTSIHNAVEVSQATWLANGSTSNGGFSVPFGGGTVNFPTAGTFYYSCTNHSLSGMKGVVIVLPGSSIEEENNLFSILAYPSPVIDFLTLSINLENSATVQISVVNILGEEVVKISNFSVASGKTQQKIDFSTLTGGVYFVRVQYGDQVKSIKIVK